MTSPSEPHFFKPLLPNFLSGFPIPLTFFAKYIQGKPNNNLWKLKTDVFDKLWEVVQEGGRITRGWEEFATAHALRIGDIVIFKHEGDMIFNVTPFGPICCNIQYEIPPSEGSSSSSFNYCFEAKITASNLKHDQLFLPVAATSCNALNKSSRQIILVNEEGTSLTVSLGFAESTGLFYIRKGWTKFCFDNKREVGDSILFNVVGDGNGTPLMCICPDEED